jgi:hypothetical protein
VLNLVPAAAASAVAAAFSAEGAVRPPSARLTPFAAHSRLPSSAGGNSRRATCSSGPSPVHFAGLRIRPSIFSYWGSWPAILQIGFDQRGFALIDHLHRLFGIGRPRVEQRAFLDIAVDHFPLGGPQAHDGRFLRSVRLEVETLVGPFQPDHKHDCSSLDAPVSAPSRTAISGSVLR